MDILTTQVFLFGLVNEPDLRNDRLPMFFRCRKRKRQIQELPQGVFFQHGYPEIKDNQRILSTFK